MCCQDIKAFFVNAKEETHRKISQTNIAYLIGCDKSTISKWNRDESKLLGAYYAQEFYGLMVSPHKVVSDKLETIGISISESDWNVAQEHYASWRKQFDARFMRELSNGLSPDNEVVLDITRDIERILSTLEFTLNYEIENRIKHHFKKHENSQAFELNVRRDIRRSIEHDARQKITYRIRNLTGQRLTRRIRRYISLLQEMQV